jgi:glutathione S-transferase
MWLTNTLQSALIVYFYPQRWMDEGNEAGVAQLKRQAERKVAGLLDQLDDELARHGGPWFAGEKYSALDPYVFTLCRWTRGFQNEQPARARAHLGPYLQRMLARASVQRVIANEKLAAPFF